MLAQHSLATKYVTFSFFVAAFLGWLQRLLGKEQPYPSIGLGLPDRKMRPPPHSVTCSCFFLARLPPFFKKKFWDWGGERLGGSDMLVWMLPEYLRQLLEGLAVSPSELSSSLVEKQEVFLRENVVCHVGQFSRLVTQLRKPSKRNC